MRPIDADALEKEIKRVYCTGCNDYHGVRCRACATDDALDLVDDAPTIDVEPVRHGRWGAYHITGYDGLHPTYTVPCLECSYEATFTHRFCPNCGAKMDEEVQHD